MSTIKVPVSDNKPIVKYKVLTSEKYGRYLVAGQKINAGEVILREKPVVIGPKVCNHIYEHLCSECLKIIPMPTIEDDSDILCSNCQVAFFCSVTCEARKFHHSIEECKILKNRKFTFRVENILLPLRLWLIKEKDEELWEKVLRLEAHVEERRNTEIWQDCEEEAIKIIKKLGIVDKSEENNFSELLHRLCGILDINSFEAPLSDNVENSASCGLYLEASLMNHDCRGNTFWFFDNEFELTIHASKPIEIGEMITFNYTSTVMGMAKRQEQLRKEKYFECDCPMCEDPYELGTNLSTLFCPYCNDGLITFASKTTKNPYVKEKNWKCNECQISLSGYLIAVYLYLVQMRIESVENSIEELEVLLEKLSSTFHPNHFQMLFIKQRLCFLYETVPAFDKQSEKVLKRKIEIGTNIVNILEIIKPGMSYFKARYFYDLSWAILAAASLDSPTYEERVKLSAQAEKYLEKSAKMMLYAPAATPIGILAKRVLGEYKSLRQCRSDNIEIK